MPNALGESQSTPADRRQYRGFPLPVNVLRDSFAVVSGYPSAHLAL